MCTLAAAALCLAVAAPGHAEIAYVSDGRIWASRADGSERRLLVAPTRRGESLAQPAWSPDGSRLAYVSERGEQAQLMVLDAAGARAVTERRARRRDVWPSWSPDGTALAFGRYVQLDNALFRTSIVTRALATGAERVLVTERMDSRLTAVTAPAWSPDGATISYTRTRLDRSLDFRPALWTVAAGGGPPRLVIREAQNAAWSPDGRRLAVISVRDRNGKRCGLHECSFAGELYTAAADGSGLTRLTDSEGDDAAPAWSPDGSRILFTSDRNLPEGDSAEVYSIAADGSCLTWLTNGTPASGDATWRPGSGDRFDPGSCDPRTRPARIDTPRLPAIRGGLWLGPRYRGLLLARARFRFLSYDDCDRFDPRDCPQTVDVSIAPACRPFAFRGLRTNAYRYLRRRGALVAYHSPLAGVRIFSGHAVATIYLEGSNRLRAVDRVIRALRPLGTTRPARRLPPPRVPRRLVRELDDGEPLREALRSFGPYRVASCKGSRGA